MHHKEDFAETNIQAILFADSFQTKFLPLSQDVPKVLMPVANVSMIDYTIKFLKDNRIKDIIVFTSNNRSKLEEYFRKVNALEKKKKQARTFNINVFSTEERSSVGQALRDIHHKGWIQSEDILLIFGDVVANFDLSGAISQHMAKKKDRNILTKIFKKVPLNSPLRTEDDDCVVIVDNNTSQVLQYKHIGSEKDIDFNLEKIDFRKSRNNIEVHYDWIDTDISICNKEVFHLINENLYNDFRDDLIYDILTSEIVEERIHAHVLSDSDFAAKVSDYRTYGIINQYITSRWLYPIVPSTHDLKLLDKNTTRYTDFNVYVDEGVNIGYTAKVSKGSVLGKDTNIDEGSVIERSVLGKNCKIGKNVKIIESIIWNNVTINNDCVLDHCIVADGAIIGANTHIQPGVVLSQNTEVAANATIPTRTLISSKEGAELPYLVKGKKFEDKDFTLRDEEFLGSTPEYFKQMQQYPEETEEEDEEEDETGFKEDVANLLEASIKDKVEVENIAIELESSRLRANATFSDCIVHAVPIIFQQIQIGDGSIKEIVNNLNQTLTRWAKLFKSIVRIERDEGVLIEQVEEFCKEHQAFASAFHLFLQFLYKLEILGAGMIIEWGKEAEQSEDEDVKKHYKLAEPFVNFLKQQEEEDDEEEEEEEEEEGEDEDDS